jgi:SAM-dependent methyltransferase
VTSWDERFRAGEYPRAPEPSAVLERAVAAREPGRALDVATGTGRNAVPLAARGWTVDAVDRSREGLRIARARARERDAAARLNPIRADVATHALPESTYDLVAVSFYRVVDRWPDLTAALAPDGLLFVEHHLRSTDPAVYEAGPSGDRYRHGANELLRAGLGLTVLQFEAGTETRGDRTAAVCRLLARASTGERQSYPPLVRHGAAEGG